MWRRSVDSEREGAPETQVNPILLTEEDCLNAHVLVLFDRLRPPASFTTWRRGKSTFGSGLNGSEVLLNGAPWNEMFNGKFSPRYQQPVGLRLVKDSGRLLQVSERPDLNRMNRRRLTNEEGLVPLKIFLLESY
jgi:hypothetical protein